MIITMIMITTIAIGIRVAMKQYFCTHCGVLLKDFAIDLSLYISIDRRVESKWEKINNSEVINSELLCCNCLDKFLKQIENFKKD